MSKNNGSDLRGLLPTPSLPEDIQGIELSENSRQVLTKRYLRKGKDGEPIETVEEMFWRVSYHVAKIEETWDQKFEPRVHQFYQMLTSKKFFPNSPTFTGAGTPLGQLAACFVLPISDDMGRCEDGIFSTLRNAALIQQTGGGNGFSFSRLRPSGSRVKKSAGKATGPIGFMRVYDQAFGEIAQGGTRRGANMGVLRVDHPDIEQFVTCKTDENAITNFNISVGITDAFMKAVKEDTEWDLRFPDVRAPEYQDFDGDLDDAIEAGNPIKTFKTIRARDLFDKIVNQAHHNGEPGMLFLDTANHENPVPHLYRLESTNPCGEQWLGPYENCCLGSINLAKHFGPDNNVNWEALRKTVQTATIFLDDVVEANAYVPAIPQLEESAKRARRIGLGIMGLADLLYHVGIRYGSAEGQEFAAQVMEFIRYHTMLTSIELAKQRGSFPAIDGSIYDPNNLQWQPPSPIMPFTHNYNRPDIEWENITKGILQHGLRNAAQTTIAPTGTIATVAGCEGYGCEPVFALAYTRHVNDNGKDLQLNYVSPLFQKALEKADISPEQREVIINQVIKTGTCRHIEDLPEFIKDVFVVSSDISAKEHVRMQAALQAFVDNSISKTINFPATASTQDVANAYLLAWELGCKGLTVYVTGSREQVVLETKGTADSRLSTKDKDNLQKEITSQAKPGEQLPIWHDTKKPRPSFLKGYTYSVETPLGKAFVTVNENGNSQPFEVFVTSAKAGSETAAHSEAIGRLISYILRIASPVEPRKRLKAVMDQLAGIGGGRSLGFGPNRIRSLPDGIAKTLDEYLYIRHWESETSEEVRHVEYQPLPLEGLDNIEAPLQRKIGELCPECGQATLVNEEGCRKCYTCGFSEC
ncbi:MAG: adenosylcobalamin-dependent ribonucleoside-diphosphate reductase [Chloroflexota bacterium]|nr:adenosylcobalamin-dependent ribonucleoside-diphosphate reductase [Chloroflexota bacterium]